MSSFNAKLFINDEVRNILNVNQAYKQVTDITGRPEGKPYGASLFIAIESTKNDDFFYHNMFSPSNKVKGEVVFYKRDGFSILFKMEFANAYILGLNEEFDAYDSNPLHMNLEIGWGIMKMKGILHQERWNPDNPFEEVETTVLEEREPAFLGYYFEDENEERIEQEEIEIDKEIYLVIETENADGDSITIDLDDDNLDYKYNGKILENDIIKGITITGEQTKVKLIAIEEQKK
ncbi:type VI secretion system tube protein TssD [Tenacibaculum sp.]|nr:type VI secretion system tube protein TssD [Tenacibaculum sp.]